MPRYFFDVHDGIDITDDVGKILSNNKAAATEVIRIAGLYANDPKVLKKGGELVITVRDAQRAILMTGRLGVGITYH